MSEDNHLKILDLDEQDRPREKLISLGAQALSDSELLGILIGSGVGGTSAVELGRQILNRRDNNLIELGKISFQELCSFKGIGDAKAVTLLAAFELSRRRALATALEKTSISSSLDAFHVLHPILSDLDHEELWVLFLNVKNKLIDKVLIGKGGLSSTLADIRLIMREALRCSATGFIMAHNHPSGSTQPSRRDDELTQQAKDAGDIMDIRLRDHLIIGPAGLSENLFFSYHDNGKIL